MKFFSKKSSMFTDEELKFILGRIEIELDWGPQIYEQSDVNLMNSIKIKLEKQLNHGNK